MVKSVILNYSVHATNHLNYYYGIEALSDHHNSYKIMDGLTNSITTD